jgi:chloride channel protein, CIC family
MMSRHSWPPARALGLATGFSAPVAGAVFVLEELVRRFDTRITITSLCASGSAVAVARLLLGNGPDFQLEPLPYSGFGTVPIFLVLGAIAGLLGVAYNHMLLGALGAAERLGRWLPGEVRAMTIGVAVGLLAWFGPGLVGGGDPITQRTLAGSDSMMVVCGVFLIRFGLGPVSYAAGTPGGLFTPLLVLGAQSGLVLGTLLCRWFPYLAERPAAFAVVGMGRVLHRCRACSGHWHHFGHRDDGMLHASSANVASLLRGHDSANLAGRFANLR